MSEEAVNPNSMRERFQLLRHAIEALDISATGDIEELRASIQGLRTTVAEMDTLMELSSKTATALRESEDRFRLLVAAVEEYAIFMLDQRGVVLSWNQGAQRIKGYTADEIIGQNFARFYLPEDVAAGRPMLILSLAAQFGHYSEEGWRQRKDGSRFWASIVITAIYNTEGELWGFSKVTRDMTERKVVEEALRQSEERFRLLVEGVREYAIFMLDPQGYVSSWNTGAEIMKGYAASEIVGKHFSNFYLPDDLEAGKPAWELTIAQSEGRYEEEGWRQRKDGTRFWANVLITALYDATGQLRGYAKITRDLTERKRAEQERLQQQTLELELARQLEVSRQMELAVQQRDEFFAVASHELKTPLTTIVGNMQLHQRRLANYSQVPEPEHQRAQIILHQAMRMHRLINSLLDISRVRDHQLRLNLEQVDMVDLTGRMADELRPMLKHHQFDLRLPEEPALILGDRDRMEAVLQNLLQNAIKYSPDGGRITLQLEAEVQHVCLTIADTGIGIAAEDLPHIFERFYRGNNVEQGQISGMGVGLYLVNEVISLHGGRIEVTSQPGAGSRFALYLPVPATAQ